MPNNARKIIAWVAIGLMIIFFISLIFVMSLSSFMQVQMRAIALVSGVAGLTLWLLLKIDDKSKAEVNENKIEDIIKKGAEDAEKDFETSNSEEINESNSESIDDKNITKANMSTESFLTRVLLFSRENVQKAAKAIRLGEIVAFGTETVYGLGADATNEQAVAKIFKAKNRPQDNPLIVHFADVADIEKVAVVEKEQLELLSKLMPSALTVILPKKDSLPDVVTAGLKTVAVRVPASDKARAFIRECGTPIAAPSANSSGRPSPTSAAHVLDDMNGRVPIILDCGACVIGLESTVLDLTVSPEAILRQGGITLESLKEYFPEVRLSETALDGIPKSPGQKYRHYAPSIPLYVFAENETDKLIEKYNATTAQNDKNRAIVMALDSQRASLKDCEVFSLGADTTSAAHNLFDALRRLEKDYDVIYSLEVPSDGVGKSVNSRLKKASTEF